MSDFIEKCYCSNDKYVWIGGAVVTFILLIVSSLIFDWFPEITKIDSIQIDFWLWYGLAGIGGISFLLFLGGFSIYKYCTYQKVKPGEEDVRFFILVFGFVFFLAAGILIMMYIDNFEDAHNFMESRIMSIQNDLEIREELKHQQNKYLSDSWMYENFPEKYLLFIKWIEEDNCHLLIDWAERNYAHSAEEYAWKLIKEKDNCRAPLLEFEMFENECYGFGGDYVRGDHGFTCTNYEPVLIDGVAKVKECNDINTLEECLNE